MWISNWGFACWRTAWEGAAAGELASQLFRRCAREVFAVHTADSESSIWTSCSAPTRWANERILDHVRENPGHAGMG